MSDAADTPKPLLKRDFDTFMRHKLPGVRCPACGQSTFSTLVLAPAENEDESHLAVLALHALPLFGRAFTTVGMACMNCGHPMLFLEPTVRLALKDLAPDVP